MDQEVTAGALMQDSDDDDLASFLAGLHSKYSHLLPTAAAPVAKDTDVQTVKANSPVGAKNNSSLVAQAAAKAVSHATTPGSPGFQSKLKQVQDSLLQLRSSLGLRTAGPQALAPSAGAIPPPQLVADADVAVPQLWVANGKVQLLTQQGQPGQQGLQQAQQAQQGHPGQQLPQQEQQVVKQAAMPTRQPDKHVQAPESDPWDAAIHSPEPKRARQSPAGGDETHTARLLLFQDQQPVHLQQQDQQGTLMPDAVPWHGKSRPESDAVPWHGITRPESDAGELRPTVPQAEQYQQDEEAAQGPFPLRPQQTPDSPASTHSSLTAPGADAVYDLDGVDELAAGQSLGGASEADFGTSGHTAAALAEPSTGGGHLSMPAAALPGLRSSTRVTSQGDQLVIYDVDPTQLLSPTGLQPQGLRPNAGYSTPPSTVGFTQRLWRAMDHTSPGEQAPMAHGADIEQASDTEQGPVQGAAQSMTGPWCMALFQSPAGSAHKGAHGEQLVDGEGNLASQTYGAVHSVSDQLAGGDSIKPVFTRHIKEQAAVYVLDENMVHVDIASSAAVGGDVAQQGSEHQVSTASTAAGSVYSQEAHDAGFIADESISNDHTHTTATMHGHNRHSPNHSQVVSSHNSFQVNAAQRDQASAVSYIASCYEDHGLSASRPSTPVADVHTMVRSVSIDRSRTAEQAECEEEQQPCTSHTGAHSSMAQQPFVFGDADQAYGQPEERRQTWETWSSQASAADPEPNGTPLATSPAIEPVPESAHMSAGEPATAAAMGMGGLTDADALSGKDWHTRSSSMTQQLAQPAATLWPYDQPAGSAQASMQSQAACYVGQMQGADAADAAGLQEGGGWDDMARITMTDLPDMQTDHLFSEVWQQHQEQPAIRAWQDGGFLGQQDEPDRQAPEGDWLEEQGGFSLQGQQTGRDDRDATVLQQPDESISGLLHIVQQPDRLSPGLLQEGHQQSDRISPGLLQNRQQDAGVSGRGSPMAHRRRQWQIPAPESSGSSLDQHDDDCGGAGDVEDAFQQGTEGVQLEWAQQAATAYNTTGPESFTGPVTDLHHDASGQHVQGSSSTVFESSQPAVAPSPSALAQSPAVSSGSMNPPSLRMHAADQATDVTLQESVTVAEWERVNQALMEAGFSGLLIMDRQGSGHLSPEPGTLLRALHGVLQQFTRRQRLVTDLLAATEAAANNEASLHGALDGMRRQLSAAQRAAERAEQRADELSSQQLPRTKAEHQAQLAKLQAQVMKLKEQGKSWEAQLAERDSQIKSLNSTIQGLQLSSSQSSDSELAGMRVKVAQLEALLKAKDKDLERARQQATSSHVAGAEDKAAALERAFAAEDASQRASAEVEKLRARLQQLEQSSTARERELLVALSEADAQLSSQLAALSSTELRLTAAEEAARTASSEAAQAKSRAASLDAALKSSQKEVAHLKADAEAMRSAAYDELYRAEDELRTVKEELGTRTARVSHLEHVIRAKEREVARAKEERDAGKAAERERAKVAEDIAVRIDTELQAVKARAAQLEASLRVSQREARSLEEALRAARGQEYDQLVKSSKAEDGSKRVEGELAAAKMRAVQLEGQLKAKERDLATQARQLDSMKSELHEASSKSARLDDAVKASESTAATARSRALSLEGALRVKEREVERLTRVLEGAKMSEAQLSTRISSLEDMVRRAEGDLAASRVRAAQLEAGLKAKDAAIDKLNRQLDVARREEHNTGVQAVKTEEEARKLDTDLTGLRARLAQQDAQLKAKDKKAERLGRQLEVARAAEYEAVAQKLQAEEALIRLESELAQAKQTSYQAESVSKSRAKDLERLHKMMDMVKASEFDMSIKQAQAEEAARSTSEEAAAANKKSQQLEATLKLREKELDKVRKQLEEAQTSVTENSDARSKAEAAEQACREQCTGLRQRATAAEGVVKAKEREIAKLMKQVQAARGTEYEVTAQSLASEAAAQKLEEQITSMRTQVQQLETQLQSRDMDVEQLRKQLASLRSQEVAAAWKLKEAEDAGRKLDAELAGLRAKLVQAESSAKARDRQLQRLEHMLDAAKAEQLEAEQRRAGSEAAAREAAEEAAASRQRCVQVDQALRAKEREVERLRRALDGNKSSEVELVLKQEKAEQDARQVTADMAATKQRLAQLETSLKTAERELEKQHKAVAAARAAEHTADLQQAQAEEAVKQLDSELVAAKQQVVAVEAALRMRDRDMDALQHLLEQAKGAELMSAAHRARAEDQAKQAGTELSAARTRVTQLEAQLKARDKALERSQRALQDHSQDLGKQLGRSDVLLQSLEGQLTGFRTQVAQLQAVVQARDRKIMALHRALGSARSQGHTSDAAVLQSAEAAVQLRESLAALRSRVAALENELKGKTRESEHIQKALDAAKAVENEMRSRQAALEAAVLKMDQDAAAARQQLVKMTAAGKSRADQAARQKAAVAAAEAAEQDAYDKRMQAEEACRQLEAEVQSWRQRLVQAEGQCRSREREVAALQRQLHSVRKDEYEASAQAAAAEEATKKLDDDLAAMRSRLRGVESSLQARDHELARLNKQANASKDVETSIQDRADQAEEAFKKLDADVAGLRQRLLHLTRTVAAKDAEVLRLNKALDSSKAAEVATEQRWRAAEDTARAAREDSLAQRHSLAQMETSLRAGEQQAQKAHKAAESAQAAQAAAELRAQEAQAQLQEAEQVMAGLRQKLAQSETALQGREREVDKLHKTLLAAKGIGYETEAQKLASEEAAKQLDEQLSAIRTRVQQLESVLKAKDKEVERYQKQLAGAKNTEAQLLAQKAQLEEAGQQLQQEVVGLRAQVLQLEGALKAKGKELAAAQKQLDVSRSSEYNTQAAKLQTEEAARGLDDQLASNRQRISQLEAQLKSRDKDMERLQKQLDAARAAEFEAEVQRSQAEEEARCREQEAASLRARMAQQEGLVRAKDKEVIKANRLADAAKAAESQMCTLKEAAESSASRWEGEAASLRTKVAQLEGSLRQKDKECARASVAAEAAAGKTTELQAQISKAESGSMKAHEEAATARGKALLLESNIKVKEREVERLTRLLEAARATEFELTSAHLQAQEATRQVDDQLAISRQRIGQLDAQLQSRDKEIERLHKLVESLKVVEQDLTSKQLQTEEAARQLDGGVLSLKQQLLAQEAVLRARNKEVERLQKQLAVAGGASADELKELHNTVHKLQSELAQTRSKLVAMESSMRAKDADTARLSKMVESLRASEADFASRAAAAESAQRQAEAAVDAAKQRSVQLESKCNALEQDAARERAVAARSAADAKDAAADAATAQQELHRAQADVQAAKQRASQLEAQLKASAKEVDRLQRQVDATKGELSEALARAAKLEEGGKKMEGDASSLRGRLAHTEAVMRVKEREVERLTRLLSSSEAQGSASTQAGDEAMRRAADELGDAAKKLTQLESQLKARTREVEQLQKQLDANKVLLEGVQEQLSLSESGRSQAESDAQIARQRAAQQEGQLKARDKEVERLQKQLEAARSQAEGTELTSSRGAAKMAEEVKRLESALSQAQVHATSLESKLAARDRELATLQKSETWRRDAEAESAVTAGERAARAEAQLQQAELELSQCKARAGQLEHLLRNREASMEKLKAVLADKVTREERLLARDKQVYARLKSAFAAHRADVQGRNAAGAVAAAARELRPVEIVGVYEQQRENLELELTTVRKEVRLLSDQLRDAQNLIATKERTNGWRNPAADAEIQAKVAAQERRCAELTRELNTAREQAADALRTATRQKAEAEHRAQALAEENASLLTELNARPTLQENRSLKREVDILERRIADLRKGGSNGGGMLGGAAGAASEAGEMTLAMQAASRSGLTSRERMRRDKEVHRLGLKQVEDMPRDVLVDLVQDVCIELDVGDATLLPTSARKLLRVVSAVPRMEAFIAQVCETVYVTGEALLPAAIRGGPQDPNKVVGVLKGWLIGLHEGQALKAGMSQVCDLLASRPGLPAGHPPPTTPQEVLLSIRQLVAVEVHAQAGAASMAGAEHLLAGAPPSDVLAAAIKHFQQLFECPRVQGLVATMNKVYMSLSEQRNFLTSLTQQLGLPTGATTTACAAAVQELITTAAAAQQRGSSSAPDQAQHTPAASGAGDRAGTTSHPNGMQQAPAIAPEVQDVLNKLMAMFNATAPAQVLVAAERLVGRLQRLDQVVPKYQSVTSQLLDMLRVRRLDELVPATQQLLTQVGA